MVLQIKEVMKMKQRLVWQNIACGNIHFTLSAAMVEAHELYGWPRAGVLFNELYRPTMI